MDKNNRQLLDTKTCSPKISALCCISARMCIIKLCTKSSVPWPFCIMETAILYRYIAGILGLAECHSRLSEVLRRTFSISTKSIFLRSRLGNSFTKRLAHARCSNLSHISDYQSAFVDLVQPIYTTSLKKMSTVSHEN